jgi:hypothetical protein
MASDDEVSRQFLHQAARHFVYLTFRDGGTGELLYASCFVVEIDGHWFLITAGHVIEDIKTRIAQGGVLRDFYLQDKQAGHSYPFGIPFPFDIDAWIIIDSANSDGCDYAGTLLSSLIVANLYSGGVKPLHEDFWADRPFQRFKHWLLLGVPLESHGKHDDGQHYLKLTLIPLTPSNAPRNADSVSNNREFAKLLHNPEKDQVYIDDVQGMSGGPIFGVNIDGATLSYRLIGVQSSWYRQSRIISFCAVQEFLVGIKNALSILRERNVLGM